MADTLDPTASMPPTPVTELWSCEFAKEININEDRKEVIQRIYFVRRWEGSKYVPLVKLVAQSNGDSSADAALELSENLNGFEFENGDAFDKSFTTDVDAEPFKTLSVQATKTVGRRRS